MAEGFKEAPTDFIWTEVFRRHMKLAQVPDVFGACFFGNPIVLIQSPHYLNDLYITKNATITKDK